LREWRYEDQDLCYPKGAEMGRFLLGSTVVMLFPRASLDFNPAWAPARPIRLGEAMGARHA
jgi:phosphatidylserine decarboxylase